MANKKQGIGFKTRFTGSKKKESQDAQGHNPYLAKARRAAESPSYKNPGANTSKKTIKLREHTPKPPSKGVAKGEPKVMSTLMMPPGRWTRRGKGGERNHYKLPHERSVTLMHPENDRPNTKSGTRGGVPK